MIEPPLLLSDLQMAQRPGIIELGLGYPDPTLLPTQAIQEASIDAFARFGVEPLNYGWAAGPSPLLEWLRQRIGKNEGRTPDPDQIMITGGISHALDQLLTLCTKPGDTALVESPTYHLAVRILRDHPLNLVPVPADDEGLRVDALSHTLVELQRKGTRPRLLYTVPTFNNPTGVSLSEARRKALSELAAQNDLLIIEDDAYRELHYDAPAPPSLWSRAPDGVVARLGSFSKSLAPGLRLGWLTASAEMIKRHAQSGLLDSGGGVNQFTAMVVATLCGGNMFDQHVAQLRTAYRSHRDALLSALNEYLSASCTWRVPNGGFFIWLTLPDGMNAEQLLAHAEAAGVAFLPSARFYVDDGNRKHNALRLAFSLYAEEKLTEAAQRLAQAIASY